MENMRVTGIIYDGRIISCIEFGNEESMNKFLMKKENLEYDFLMSFDYTEKQFWYITKEKFLISKGSQIIYGTD